MSAELNPAISKPSSSTKNVAKKQLNSYSNSNDNNKMHCILVSNSNRANDGYESLNDTEELRLRLKEIDQHIDTLTRKLDAIKRNLSIDL